MPPALSWQCLPFEELSPLLLYQILGLRDRVFVVEQRSIYGDVDGLDPGALHIVGRGADGQLAAYARVLAPGVKDASAAAIGRVVLEPTCRGGGLGKALLAQAVAACERHYPGAPMVLSAQVEKLGFYQGFGFVAEGEPYDDGGVLHQDMRRG